MAAGLASLLKPTSVAIVGASDDPTRIGGRPLRYLLEAGFAGAIYPVNPNRSQVQGLTSYRSVSEIPGPVDFALLVVPASVTADAVAACAANGVKAVAIISAGFAEVDGQGARLQARLVELAKPVGMRILGPNCLGLFNSAIGFFPTFTATLDRGFPQPGRVAIISQSGAYGSHVYLLARQRGLDIKYWITTGNECDVHVAECLLWLVDDPDTDVIVAYAEGIRDGNMLKQACARARAQHKPIIFMKVGKSAVGAVAAASHTASLAGSDAVYDAVFRQYGVHRARSTEELLDVAYACNRGLYPKGIKLGLVTISGGVGVQMADAADDYGLDTAPMPEDAQRRLKEILPFAAVRNPVDITAQAFNDMSLVTKNMELMLERGGYDVILAFFTSVAGSQYIAGKLRAALKAACDQFTDRLLVLSIVASEEICHQYEAEGYLVFEDPTRAVAAIKALCQFGQSFADHVTSRLVLSPTVSAPLPAVLDEHAAKNILAAAGIPTVAERLVQTPQAAALAAEELGFPVVVKIVSPDIQHKTEIGGVVLNLNSSQAVRRETEAILQRVRAARPKARLEGILVAPQLQGGVETILGVHRDPVFGPVVMFGLGGIFVEVLNDVTFRAAPFDETEARRMIREVKGHALLDGVRGGKRSDLDALVQALSKLSVFAASHAPTLESIDINPFLVRPDGEGALALDALIVPRRLRA